ncbi:MAG TPA: DUF2283 domain-containing protein [Thermomicrobiaceae bacterium]|nr:DUF2283 domain-containing protein [Thermomicrobiaceae bacterium]
MKITYDPEADALYIQLRSVRPADSFDLQEGVTADVDDAGHIIGIEILDARQQLGDEALTSVSVEQLLATPRETARR